MNILFRLCVWFAKCIYPTLESLIKIDPPERRSSGVFSSLIQRGIPGLNFNNDSDHLIYKQSIVIFSTMVAMAIATVLDAIFSMGLLVNVDVYQREPRSLAIFFRDISVLPWLMITVIFYIRIRFSLNLSSDNIPININPSFYDDETKGNWVIRPLIIIIPFIVLLLHSNAFVFGVVRYFSAEKNTLIIFSSLLFVSIGLSAASLITVMKLLMIEKAYSHFSDLRRQLLEIKRAKRASSTK